MKKVLLLAGIICSIILGTVIGYRFERWQKIKLIDNFEKCSIYFPVQESFPATCKANNQTFIQKN